MATPKVFVAYPYSFSKNDYRRAYKEVGKAHGVKFTYADERITNSHILAKIEGMIRDAEFSIFDITTWNPNVALELGIAVGAGLDYYIAFNPTGDQSGVPSDIGGIDRLQYTDYSELGGELARLMTQQFGPPVAERDAEAKAQADAFSSQMEALTARIPEVIRENPGLAIGGVASQIGVPLEITQTLVRPLIGEQIRTEGVKRGTRYYPVDEDS
jgi:hypothetical protein